MARVDHSHAAPLRGLYVEAVGEPVAFQLSEQAQTRRSLDHLRADEGRSVADEEHIEVRGKTRQLGLGLAIARNRRPVLGVDREGAVGEIGGRLQAGDVCIGDIIPAHRFVAGKPDTATPAGRAHTTAHLIATEPSSRNAVRDMSAEITGCLARPASSSSIPIPGRSGASR